MISQVTLLQELAEQVEMIAAAEPQLGLTEIQPLPDRGMITVELPNLGGSPARFMVLIVRDNELQLRVHNVCHTTPPMGTENRAARLFLEDGPPSPDDAARRGLLGLHVESALRAPRTPGDLVQCFAITSNNEFTNARACHDPRDGELYVKAGLNLADGSPAGDYDDSIKNLDRLNDLITQAISQASMIIAYSVMVESVTEMSPGVSMPVEDPEIDDGTDPPTDGDEAPAEAGDGSERNEDWL